MSESAYRRYLEQGEIKAIRLVRNSIPDDLAAVFEVDEEELGTLETVLRPRRNRSFRKRKIQDVLSGERDVSSVLQWRDVDYSEVKVQVKVGGTMRTVSVSSGTPPAMLYDLDEELTKDGMEFTDEWAYGKAALYAEDLASSMGVTSCARSSTGRATGTTTDWRFRVSLLIDVRPLVKDHFSTLRSAGTNKYMWDAVALFYGVPPVLGGPGILLEWRVGGVGNILAAFALLVGLLFNLLVLLFDVAIKAKSGFDERKLKFARQMQATVTYTLLVSLVTTVVLGVEAGMGVDKIDRWVSGALIALFAHFVLTLMMILRRIRVAFLNNFR